MVRFTEHAEDRLKEYGIPKEDVERVLEEPERVFLDVKTGRFVAIKRWKSKHDEPLVITVFPTSRIDKVMKRVGSGRWVEL